MTTVELIPTPEVLSEGYWGVAEVHPQPSGNQQIELRLNNLDKPEPHSFYEAWFSSGDKYISAGTFTAEGPGETKVWLTAPPESRDYHALLITEQSAQDDTTPRGVISVVQLLSVWCNDLVSIRSSIYYVVVLYITYIIVDNEAAKEQ